ncbi:MAG: 5-bromo-4-chloroindolyl phosphate hydrolysis family protein [Lachnospiraceae bacterium]|nr:5-bromo-4-chloroindolyl phosphate hydrolysis family protein [Lachnospiraceae bacterium]
MSGRRGGRFKGWLILGIILMVFVRGFSISGLVSFLLLFGISIAVIVALARLGSKKSGKDGEPGVKVDTSASPKDNVNPYSSTYHESAAMRALPEIVQETEEPEKAGAAVFEKEDQKKKEKEKERKENVPKEPKPELTSYGAQKRKRTGDSEIDALLDEEEKAIAEMRRLDDSILDEKVSAQIVHLEDVTSKIVDCIVEKPAKRLQVKKFFGYYLPTTLKLLNSYDRMDEVGISGTNIDGAKGSIEALMDTALAAFDKELDSLYGDEAIDVTSDIKVMESMLAQDGLTDDDLMKLLK